MEISPEALIRTFEDIFQRGPTVISSAPGRVNLIGEHTDYNEGFVLPVAIDRTIAVAAEPNESARFRVYSVDFGACDEFSLGAIDRPARDDWRNYPRGVVWALAGAGHVIQGSDVAVLGEVPQGAGLSSSAALELAIGGALCAVSGITIEPKGLALLCQKAENEFVGVQCGVMDQLASACSLAGHALLMDCRSLEIQPVPLPDDLAIIVVDSKARRSLANTAYNQRREECAEAALHFGVRSLREVQQADELESLPKVLQRRARHVMSENARVLAFAEALRAGDMTAAGGLMYESHASLRDDFEVSMRELDLLVELASRMPGVYGSRLTGAGFGGCTVTLVDQSAVGGFERSVVEPYRERTGLAGEMHVCRVSDGLQVMHV